MPPLRDMRDAIIPLAIRLLQETCWVIGRAVPLLDKGVQSMLTDSGWPGNIRQLKSVIRRILINADDVVTAPAIAVAIQAGDKGYLPEPVLTNLFQSQCPPPFPYSMDALEKWSFEQALNFCGGKQMRTAVMLEMNYSTFKRRLKKHGVILGQDEQEDL
jgi:DNA-binding NtrC family response regulator